MTLSMVVEHLSMVVFAIVIAILIGVPLGLLCYLSRAARGVVLRVVDLIQTTPPWPCWASSWSPPWGRASQQ